MPSSRVLSALLLPATLLAGCGDGPAEPDVVRLVLSEDGLTLGALRSVGLTLRNSGTRTAGPVEITTSPVQDPGGGPVPGSQVAVEPSALAELAPGASVELELTVELGGTLPVGTYTSSLAARAGSGARAAVPVQFTISGPEGDAATVELKALPSSVRQGDVVGVAAVARDADGNPLEGAPIVWSIEPPEAGLLNASGAFVGYEPGSARIVARAGDAVDEASLIVEERGLSGSFELVGRGLETGRHTSDLWVRGGHAYLGTWGTRSGVPGNTLFTWSVADPAAPVRTDSLRVDAGTVNDVKVHPDRPLALLTHEHSLDGQNGITLLDLEDPAHPLPITRFTEGLETGVHNAWLDGDHAYVVADGVGNGLRVVDVSDPAEPRLVGSYWGGESVVHDVYVRDGLAFLSHWDAGLVVLDVGHGVAGGSPENPVEVSRLADLGGETHNAWYWPEAGYAFVGEEDFSAETPGFYHVVDLRDLRNPREVATFAVPGATPHNAWLDEERGILYVAWYREGAVAVDVTGELIGDLTRQGRRIVSLRYGPEVAQRGSQLRGAPVGESSGQGGCSSGLTTCAWGPQLHEGLLYVADMNSGLVILRPSF